MFKGKRTAEFLILILFYILLGAILIRGSRIPTIGGDTDSWGTVLNEYLQTEHGSSGLHTNITATRFNLTGDLIINTSLFFVNSSSGNIGINTSNPRASLEIYGDLITQGPWTDVRSYGAIPDDNINDSKAIQNALNFSNKFIFFPPGTYLLNESIYINSDTHLLGVPHKSILKFTKNIKWITNGDYKNGNENIHIQGLTIDGDYKSWRCTTFSNVEKLTVEDCEMYHCPKSNIWLGGSANESTCRYVMIANNYLHENIVNSSTSSSWTNGIAIEAAEHVNIINNILWRIGYGPAAIDIEPGYKAEYINIIGNVIWGNLTSGQNDAGFDNAAGIYLFDTSNGTNNIVVSNNIIKDVYRNRIQGKNIIVSGNYIEDIGTEFLTIHAENTIISDNIIRNGAGHPIYVYEDSRDVTISNNIIESASNAFNGIVIYGAKDIKVIGNKIKNIKNKAIAITQATTDKIVIADNEVKNASYCIHVDETTVPSSAEIRIMNNYVKNCSIEDVHITRGYYDSIISFYNHLNITGFIYGSASKLTDVTTNKPYDNGISTEGLVGYWPFDVNAEDYSGNLNDGAVNSLTHTSNGRTGSAYTWGGVDGQYIDCGNDLSLNLTNYTFAVWIKRPHNSTAQETLIAHDHHNNGNPFVTLHTNAIRVHIWNGSSYTAQDGGTLTWENNTWYHVAVTVEENGTDTNITYYRDGSYLDSDISNNVPRYGLNNLHIGGRSAGATAWNGSMDEVMLWNRTLTSGEIKSIYISTGPFLVRENYYRKNRNMSLNADLIVDTNTLKVDSTNNKIGIGTASPAHELTVLGTGNFSVGYAPALILDANTSAVTCNTTIVGGIIYSAGTHWGCNGTKWYAFY